MIQFQFRKLNESERHYALKQIGKYFLFKNGYSCIAEEVYLHSSNEFGNKDITDCLGIKMRNRYNNGLGDYGKLKFDAMSVEAKQSKQDYYNSFVSSADYNYIIIPKGMLDENDKYIEGVGIIEIDFDNFEFGYDKKGRLDSKNIFKSGVEITRKAKRNKGKNYYINDEFIKINLLKQIAYRNSVECLFVRSGIIG